MAIRPVARYGKTTRVAHTVSIKEVGIYADKYKAERYRYLRDPKNRRGVFMFDIFDPNKGWLSVSYGVPHYDLDTHHDLTDQERDTRYRVAAKGIQMRFEQIANGIETPAQAFHAHIVIDAETGETLFERTQHLIPAIPNAKRDR